MGFTKYFSRSHAKVSFSGPSSSDEESEAPGRRQRRRSSRWKWPSPRSSPGNRGSFGHERTGNGGTPHEKASSKPQSDNDPPPPPPILPSASSELPRAMRYFEITKETFTRETIKKKYKRLSLIHHPDRNGNAEKSIQEMQKINHFFDLMEEELNRLEEVQEGDAEVDPQRSPRNGDNNSENENVNENDEKETDTSPRNRWRSSRRKSGPILRRKSMPHRRSDSVDPKHESREGHNSNESSENHHRRRRTSTERRQRKEERQQERTDMEREMRKEWNDALRQFDNFRKKQRKLQRKNSQRSADELLDTVQGRNHAYNSYKRQAQAYQSQVELQQKVGSPEFDSIKTFPTKPKYTLMECCNEDAVVAMRLGETRIAIEIIHQDLTKTTEEWIRLKMRASSAAKAGPGVYESTSKRNSSVQFDERYFKRILQLLKRPFDADQNSILHYAVYMEDRDMILYLVQIARQYNIFARFLVYKNNRNLTAGDFGRDYNCSVSSLITTLTKEACDILDEKNRLRAARKQVEPSVFDHPLVDPLLNLILCLVFGRYVTRSGWIVSWIIIGLAHWVELGSKKTSTIRISKSFFFSLHTVWYLFVGCILRGFDLIIRVSTSIPVPWQLQLLGLAAAPLLVKLRHWPLQCLLLVSVQIESAFIFGLDWILCQNGTFSSGPAKHLVDYAVLSVPFLAVQLIYGCA